MTYKQIASMIGEIGLPFNYLQWPVNDPDNPAPPYVLFYYPNRDDFIADNKNYSPITALNIELYTDEKDFAMEAQVEAVLISHEIPFSKTEDYIDSEGLYEVLYEMEVFISG